jgi:ribosome-binding protein aMBF1 (putative translation factor)
LNAVSTPTQQLEEPAGAARMRKPGEFDRRPRRLPRRSRQLTTLWHMLVRLREDAGIDQATLASRLGITQSEVSKYERGERALDILRLRDWLGILQVEFTTFADALDQELKLGDYGATQLKEAAALTSPVPL